MAKDPVLLAVSLQSCQLESLKVISSSSVNNIDNTPDTDVGLYLSDDDIDDEGYKSVWRIVPTPPKRNGGYKTKKRKYIKKPKD